MLQATLEGALHKCRPCSDLDKKSLDIQLWMKNLMLNSTFLKLWKMRGESWYDEHSPYDLRNEGLIGNSWKKSNKGKEQYQSWHIWLLLPKRLHPIVTTNNLFNENKNQSSEASKKKTHLGSKKENSRFASMRDQECRTFFKVHLELFGKISKFRKSVQIKLVQRDNRICWKFLEIHFAVSATWFVASGLNLSIPASEKRQIYIQSHHGHHHFPTKTELQKAI